MSLHYELTRAAPSHDSALSLSRSLSPLTVSSLSHPL